MWHCSMPRAPDRIHAVPSSVIRDYAYDPADRSLEITFVSGKRYLYSRVPQYVIDEFGAAASKGEFFNKYIRERYAYVEIGGEC